jgi:hypothetical protein
MLIWVLKIQCIAPSRKNIIMLPASAFHGIACGVYSELVEGSITLSFSNSIGHNESSLLCFEVLSTLRSEICNEKLHIAKPNVSGRLF